MPKELTFEPKSSEGILIGATDRGAVNVSGLFGGMK